MSALTHYYGPEYACAFVSDVPSLEEEPSDAQMTAMFPDERVPYQVQYRLIYAGIMSQLPRPERIEDFD